MAKKHRQQRAKRQSQNGKSSSLTEPLPPLSISCKDLLDVGSIFEGLKFDVHIWGVGKLPDISNEKDLYKVRSQKGDIRKIVISGSHNSLPVSVSFSTKPNEHLIQIGSKSENARNLLNLLRKEILRRKIKDVSDIESSVSFIHAILLTSIPLVPTTHFKWIALLSIASVEIYRLFRIELSNLNCFFRLNSFWRVYSPILAKLYERLNALRCIGIFLVFAIFIVVPKYLPDSIQEKRAASNVSIVSTFRPGGIAKVKDQISLLRQSIEAYDSGQELQAIRIAASLKILLDESEPNSGIVFRAIPIDEYSLFKSWNRTPDPNNRLPQTGLAYMSWQAGRGMKYLARLSSTDGAPTQIRNMSFSQWWNEPVITIPDERSFSRRDLVKSLAETEGGTGAGDAEASFHQLARDNKIGMMYTKSGEQYPPDNRVDYATIRAIAQETLVTFEAIGLHQ